MRLLFSSTLWAFLVASISAPACRADAPPATQPSSHPADKSRYTLFNPTPPDQLRGMDTDRPNITNTPHTIDAGHMQIEAGFLDYAYYRNRSAGSNLRSDAFASGQLNFRLGVLNNLEINAVVNPFDTVRSHDYGVGTFHASGFGDSVLGGKLNLWGDDGGDEVWATALAIQPQFKFATATAAVGNGHFESSVVAPFLMNLPDGFHLSVQPGFAGQRNPANTGYVTAGLGAVALDRVMVDKLDMYVEYAADAATGIKAVQSIDVGGTYPLTNNIALDLGVNFGLNRASNNLEVLTGISFRF